MFSCNHANSNHGQADSEHLDILDGILHPGGRDCTRIIMLSPGARDPLGNFPQTK
jgi:hypothetical protein